MNQNESHDPSDALPEEQYTSCLSAKEIKALAKPEFAANPDKFYPTQTLKKLGFSRATCGCGNNYWRYSEERQTCGDSNCEKRYSFIGRGTGRGNSNNKNYHPEKLTYAEAWNGFKRSLTSTRVPCTAIKRYPVVARWRADVDYVAAGIFCFQPYCVTGELEPPANPLICPQFCLRFNDLDNIGYTGRHYSGFIMLGIQVFNKPNDFKFWMDECVEFNYRWLTEELKIDPKEITFIEDVWAGGGNLGPSIEYFVSGLELGNMVFMQYKTFPDGSREPLQVRVIDVGIGLERVPWLINGSPTSYCDVFPEALDYLTTTLGIQVNNEHWEKFGELSCLLNVDEVANLDETWKYISEKAGYSDHNVLKAAIEPVKDLYVVCDHTRSVLMAIQDGSLPSNIGGAQNIRRILRRVFALLKRRGWWDKIQLEGLLHLFECHRRDLAKIWGPFEPYSSFEPIIRLEYERWNNTDEESKEKLKRLLAKKKDGKLDLEDWIHCVTSLGITEDIVHSLTGQPIPGDLNYVIEQRKEKMAKMQPAQLYSTAHLPETNCMYFANHRQYEFEAKILEVLHNVTKNHIPNIVVLDQSCFYPTSGGQEHDVGQMIINNEEYEVVDVMKVGPAVLHVLDRPLTSDPSSYKGLIVKGFVDSIRRSILRNHHTATHIVYASCRRVLGPHVWQNGAKKSTHQAHLDITHYASLTHEQVRAIQNEANKIVAAGKDIRKGFKPKDEAEAKHGFHLYQGGAVPGNELRVVEIDETDTEACCGTHSDNTSEIGYIKILRTTRLSDGIVRLYYVANRRALELVDKESELLNALTTSWGVTQDDLISTANRFFEGYKKFSAQQPKQIQQIIELQVKCLLFNSSSHSIGIRSNENNAAPYITAVPPFAAQLKELKKSIVFVGDNFVYGFFGSSDVINQAEFTQFLDDQAAQEEKDRITKAQKEAEKAIKFGRKDSQPIESQQPNGTVESQSNKTDKRLIKIKNQVTANKGKDKKTGKKVIEKVNEILELVVFSMGVQPQSVIEYFKTKKGFKTENDL